jgi:hypothetical protein
MFDIAIFERDIAFTLKMAVATTLDHPACSSQKVKKVIIYKIFHIPK